MLLLLPHPYVEAQAPRPAEGVLARNVAYEWWGPTDATGWHFRVPLAVFPRFPDPLTRYGVTSDLSLFETPVQVEVDFTQLLRDTNLENRTGWPMDEFGRLSSFTFDPATVRVVAYDRATGRVESGSGRGGSIPFLFATSLFENGAGRNPVFNATQNAVGTLQFMIPTPFDRERLYFLYFDAKENGPKPATDWTEAELAPLRGEHFVRSGTEFYGYLPGIAGVPQARIFVWGIHGNTTVAVYRYRYVGFEPQEIPPCQRKGTVGLCLAGGRIEPNIDPDHLNVAGLSDRPTDMSFQVTTTREPTNEPFFFKVVASKPVLVFIGPAAATSPSTYQTSYWVPSYDGGLLGSNFAFVVPNSPYTFPEQVRTPGPNALVLVGGPEDAFVQWFSSTGGNGFLPVKARSAVRLTGYGAGGVVSVTAQQNKEVMLLSLPYLSHHGNQAVSSYGAPVGTTLFLTPTQTTSAAIVGHEASAVTVFNVEDPAKYYPREGPYALEAGAHNAWIPPGPTWISHNAWVWQARSSGMISAIYGDRGLFPVGGLDARDFQLVLRSAETLYPVNAKGFVMPFYPQTRVDIERYNATLDRYVSVVQKVVGPESYLATKPGTTDPVMVGGLKDPGSYRIRASKPVLVYAFAEESSADGANSFPYSTFVGGRTRSPVHALGEVEFYGPLLSWTSKLAQETVKPGEQVVATFEVKNLGRSADGRPLADSVSIVTRTQKGAPAWTTRLSTAFEANIAGGETRFVTVAVDVPKDAKTDETLDLELVAVSETNPAIRDSALLQITVQTRYEIELSFRANNRASLQSVIDPGTTREFLVRVKNVGSGPDGVSFTMLRANPFGFEADVCVKRDDGTCESFLDTQGLSRLAVDGRPVSLPLGVNEERDVVLTVTAPRTSDPAQHNFVVEGTSTSDSASRKQLTLVALTNARTALRIVAANDTFEVAPGTDATLPLEVVNEGVETVVDVRLRAAQLPGWNLTLDPVSFELRSPGVVDPRDDRPLDRRIVNLTVRAGPGAPVGFLMPIEVVAASGTRLGDAEAPEAKAFVTATVVNNFTLLVPELLERSVLPGSEVTYDLDLLSLANGNFTVAPVATRLPPGWALASADPPLSSLAPGGRATVHLVLKTRPNEAASLYQGDFGFVLEDEGGRRGVATAPFALRVKRHVDYVAVPDGAFLVPPGGVTRASFAVTNTGNVNATLETGVEAPAGWVGALVDNRQALLELAPGETRTVDVRVEAPDDPVGNAAEFALVGNIPLEREKTTPFTVTVLRDDLAVTKVEALTTRFRTGEPAVFQVTLVNNGTVPRTNVEVALVVDGHVARNVTIRSMPPGEARVVQIPWNVVPASTVSVQVDPDDVYREEDEENNRVVFDLAGAQRVALPAPAALLAALVLAGGALGAGAPATRRMKDEGSKGRREGTKEEGSKGASSVPFDPRPVDPSLRPSDPSSFDPSGKGAP